MARMRVQRDLVGVHDHVDVVALGHLAQFLRGERRLRGTAPAQHHHLTNVPLRQGRDRMARHVGARELLRRQHQHARDVHGHVAVAHHHRAEATEVVRAGAVERAGVVPGHELRARVAAGQVLVRNPQAAIRRRTHCVDDRMEVLHEVRLVDVAPHLHVAPEAEAVIRGGALVHAGDRLDLLVVGRHPRPHQAERRGHPVEHVHLHVHVVLRQQVLRRVEARWTRPDDRHPQRRARTAHGHLGHHPIGAHGRAEDVLVLAAHQVA